MPYRDADGYVSAHWPTADCSRATLLVLPSVSVLPVDETGSVLLVRHAGHDDGWGVFGGAIEIGESPAETAIREAREEIGADVRLTRLLDVLGGPDYEMTYPNGDRAAYVTAVYEAEITRGAPAAAHGELSDVAWFSRDELALLTLNRLSRALLKAAGPIWPGPEADSQPGRHQSVPRTCQNGQKTAVINGHPRTA